MSFPCDGFDQNILYLNFEKEGPPDSDQERCEVMRNFHTPLLSELRKYVVSIARFSIPIHTCYMNDRVESAITLCTYDGLGQYKTDEVAPVLLNLYGNVNAENAGQKAYRKALNLKPEGVNDDPGDGQN